MDGMIFLIPITIFMGLIGLVAFFWTVRHRQYEDMDGTAERILMHTDDRPL